MEKRRGMKALVNLSKIKDKTIGEILGNRTISTNEIIRKVWEAIKKYDLLAG